MKSISFIINPISGTGNNSISKELVSSYFIESEFQITIRYTAYKKHAIELTKESINNGANIIVACGGDGTINEVASCLVDTKIILGIIPAGSGNGFASNLKIPFEKHEALKVLKANIVSSIDVGLVNGYYFFSNSGIGFDAEVIKNYEASNKRTITSYLKAGCKALQKLDSKITYKVHVDDKVIFCKPFMIFVSNSNEMGYNLSLTPKASLTDGLLDLLIVSKMSKSKVLFFGFLATLKQHKVLKEVGFYSAKKIQIIAENTDSIEFQLDGETQKINSNLIEYKILEGGLKVIS